MFSLQQTVIESWAENQTHYEPSMSKHMGYNSLAIIYSFFALSNWIAPSVVSVIGARFSMFSGGVVYSVFIFSFLYINPYLLYSLSALLGVAAAGMVVPCLVLSRRLSYGSRGWYVKFACVSLPNMLEGQIMVNSVSKFRNCAFTICFECISPHWDLYTFIKCLT